MDRKLCIHRRTCGSGRPHSAWLALVALALNASMALTPSWAATAGPSTALSFNDYMYRCGWQVGERYYTALDAWKALPTRSRGPKPVLEPKYPDRCLADLEAKLAAEQSRLPAAQNIRQKLKNEAVRGMIVARNTHNKPSKP